jgi:thioredoxin 1
MHMNQPPQSSSTIPWFLIIGLLCGIGFVAYIVWDSAKPPPGNVVELNDDNWQREVVDSKIPVFVDFTASWCPPCRAFAPTVNRLADRYKGKVKVAKFDIDRGTDVPAQYKIKGIPHVLIFKAGSTEPVHEFSKRAPTEGEVARVFDKLLASR